MSLAGVAKETLAILERGSYTAPSGQTVFLKSAVDRAVSGTVLHRPAQLEALLAARVRDGVAPAAARPRLEVTAETTAEAGRRLIEAEAEGRVVALNFASARNPAGGFLGGAVAQEEDLARASALYPCLLTQREFYEVHRAERSLLYTDQMIYSPDVPFFRGRKRELLEAPFSLSIITAPAPNAGEVLRKDPAAGPQVAAVLDSRVAKVLVVAAEHQHRCLVLGAWGCGVFRNEPAAVADAFGRWLEHPAFAGVFDRVVFAIHDRHSEQPTLRAFAGRLAPPG